MSIGPVEYVILGFPGNKFTGQIVPELAKLIESGLIRIIDLTFISKDAAGEVSVVEYDAVEELAAFAGLDAEIGGILTEDDIAYAALSLEPNSSAALLLGRTPGRRRSQRLCATRMESSSRGLESPARSSIKPWMPSPTPSPEFVKPTPIASAALAGGARHRRR